MRALTWPYPTGALRTIRCVRNGAERPRDQIEIDGTPPVSLTIEGGVAGDAATPAVILNAAPRVVEHAPGLITMLDLPVLGGRGIP